MLIGCPACHSHEWACDLGIIFYDFMIHFFKHTNEDMMMFVDLPQRLSRFNKAKIKIFLFLGFF